MEFRCFSFGQGGRQTALLENSRFSVYNRVERQDETMGTEISETGCSLKGEVDTPGEFPRVGKIVWGVVETAYMARVVMRNIPIEAAKMAVAAVAAAANRIRTPFPGEAYDGYMNTRD